jgi:hypothetical protein
MLCIERCPGGEIGKRCGLRSRWSYILVSSSLTPGTAEKPFHPEGFFVFPIYRLLGGGGVALKMAAFSRHRWRRTFLPDWRLLRRGLECRQDVSVIRNLEKTGLPTAAFSLFIPDPQPASCACSGANRTEVRNSGGFPVSCARTSS